MVETEEVGKEEIREGGGGVTEGRKKEKTDEGMGGREGDRD